MPLSSLSACVHPEQRASQTRAPPPPRGGWHSLAGKGGRERKEHRIGSSLVPTWPPLTRWTHNSSPIQGVALVSWQKRRVSKWRGDDKSTQFCLKAKKSPSPSSAVRPPAGSPGPAETLCRTQVSKHRYKIFGRLVIRLFVHSSVVLCYYGVILRRVNGTSWIGEIVRARTSQAGNLELSLLCPQRSTFWEMKGDQTHQSSMLLPSRFSISLYFS